MESKEETVLLSYYTEKYEENQEISFLDQIVDSCMVKILDLHLIIWQGGDIYSFTGNFKCKYFYAN